MAIKIGKLFSANKLVGTGDDDTLIGGLFNDILIGGAGKDRLNGGLGGTDTVDYSTSGAGVTVDLTMGRGTGGDAEGDTYESIENMVGSAFADILIGNGGNNTMTGGAGRDVFVRSAGYDTITDFKAQAATLFVDFEAVPLNAAGLGPVPSGYLGLKWDGFAVGEFSTGDFAVLSDFAGDSLAFNKEGLTTASFSSLDGDFDLGSLKLGMRATTVTINAYDDGIRVGQTTVTINGNGFVHYSQVPSAYGLGGPFELVVTSYALSARFTSIDKVEFVQSGPNNFAIDDIRLNNIEGDKIDVADGTDIAALVASAVSDGQGGTYLTLPPTVTIGRGGVVYTSPPDGRLNLIGIDPGSVSADWFI